MSRKFIIPFLLLSFAAHPLWAQKLELSTNAVSWMAFGTINIQADYALAQHWTVGISGKYNPFTWDTNGGEKQMQFKQRSLAAHGRWWPWHVYSGWWISGKVQWQEYNVGGIISDTTEEGQRYGGGLAAGYSYMVNRHLNVDFGLGFWGGMKRYTVYSCPRCGIRIQEGVKSFILPNDLIVGLSYVF